MIDQRIMFIVGLVHPRITTSVVSGTRVQSQSPGCKDLSPEIGMELVQGASISHRNTWSPHVLQL